METSEKFLENHQNKCRCCFKYFSDDNKQVRINKIIQEWFLEVISVELKSARSKFSDSICELCKNDLEGFVQFKTETAKRQKILYEVVDGVKERPKRKRREIKYIEDPVAIPFVKIEPKEEIEEFQLRDCSVIIEPMVKTEIFDESQPEFPEHLYESDTKTNILDQGSSSSEDLIEEAFKNLPNINKKKKKRKKVTAKRPIGNFPCTECHKTFQIEQKLQEHIASVHFRVKNLSCDLCHFKTHLPRFLESHIQRQHIDNREPRQKQQCPTCGIFVSDIKNHHRQVHIKSKKYTCDLCGYGIYNLHRIKRHMWKHLPKDLKQEVGGLPCQICGAILLGKRPLMMHMRNVHERPEGRNFICYCGKTYKTETSLKIHQKVTHQPEGLKPKFQCKLCDKTFLYNQTLKDHMEIHKRVKKKSIACPDCGKLYASLQLMEKHRIFHTEPSKPCPICAKMYHTKNLLDRHIKRSHDVQFADCEYCGKSLNVSSITRHVREFHSGLERKNCPVPGCTSNFVRKHHMKDHMQRMHRPYFSSLTPEEKTALDELVETLSESMM